MPKVYGVELARAKQRAAGGATRWTRDDLLGQIAEDVPAALEPIREARGTAGH